jgi:hypothetical protein
MGQKTICLNETFRGCLKDTKDGEWDDILVGIYEDRKKISSRSIKLED